MVEQLVEEGDVPAEMGVVLAGSDALPHHGDELVGLLEGDEL